MNKQICLDMDGTIVDLYSVPNWCEKLNSCDSSPYAEAQPLWNMSQLARLLHKAQRLGYVIGIISWLSKNGTEDYNAEVDFIKRKWLAEHLPSVEFDFVKIVQYGLPKSSCGSGILFDDNFKVRQEWSGKAYHPNEMIEFLRKLS